jgi:pyruvate/2-oxoglutarate dehydrogenase complex dihydrolipoamide dehydrogenase (E3) component
MAKLLTPDICIIGGGPAGFAVAARAARMSVPVVLIEKGRMGGANLSAGAIPSKALVSASYNYELLRRSPMMGVTGAPLQVNFSRVAEHIASVAEAIAPHVSAERLAALGVRVISAPARFLDRRTVIAGEFTIIARRFVIAVGAVGAAPDIPGLDDVDYMTVADAFDIGRKPAHLVVLGANPQALEIAQAYQRLGVDTTVVDSGPALPDDDPELAAIVLNRLRADGIRVRDQVRIASAARRRGGIRITLDSPEGEVSVDGSHLLVAMGRRPNIAELGLESASVEHGPAGIAVDKLLRTTNSRIYAIGDAIAGPAIANRGDYEAGKIMQDILFRLPSKLKANDVPVVTYTDPAIARVGMSEAEAKAAGETVRVLRFPFVENDRVQAERMTSGFIKVIVSPRGRVLGAAMVGHEAGEQIAIWSLAVANRLNIRAIINLVPPYPARAEIARRVAETFLAPGLTPTWQRRIIEFLRKFG